MHLNSLAARNEKGCGLEKGHGLTGEPGSGREELRLSCLGDVAASKRTPDPAAAGMRQGEALTVVFRCAD